MTPLLLLSLSLAAPPKPVLVSPPRPVFVPVPVYYPAFWGGFYVPDYPPIVIVPPPPPLLPLAPARIEDADRAAAEVPAVLSVELPTAAAEVWLNGDKQPTDARTLASPPLKLGDSFIFRVRARWTEAGTVYEAEATSTVKAGERGKLAVYAGKPVK